MRVLWQLILVCIASAVVVGWAVAEETLLLVGQPAAEASLVESRQDGSLQFQLAGELRNVTRQQLVRWKNPLLAEQQSELMLADGSRLVLAEAWTGEPSWKMTNGMVQVNTRLFGKIELQRSQVSAIHLHPGSRREDCSTVFGVSFDETPPKQHRVTDLVCLLNGDRWEGQFGALAKNDAGQWNLTWSMGVARAPMRLPVNEIAAMVFGNPRPPTLAKARIVVGTRDGSILRAKALDADAQSLRIQLANGMVLVGSDRQEVVHLHSLEAECVYLSDLEAAGYRHLPYLEISWPFQKDRNVLLKPLRAQGRFFAKGVGMPAAARLSYPLNAPEITGRFQRFVAKVALDDAARGRGSVIFRVYLEQGGNWQLAYESAVVRGADVPVPVSVELGAATQLALVTDFAERGDELDYANWLDARLE